LPARVCSAWPNVSAEKIFSFSFASCHSCHLTGARPHANARVGLSSALWAGGFAVLNRITIQGLAVIETLTIEFGPRFNVITGETGAGKSILIKALSLLLGGKATAETVRRGSNHAMISASFGLHANHSGVGFLERIGIPFLEDEEGVEVLVRRQILAKGRSQAWINDVPVTVAVLRELGEALIDIFGQHDNHRLLDPQMHIHYLDQFLPDHKLRASYGLLYREVQDRLKSLRERVGVYSARLRDRDYLSFRCQELEDFSPDVDEYLELDRKVQSTERRRELQDRLAKVQALVDESVQGEGLSKAMWEAARLLRRMAEQNDDAQVEAHAAEAEALAGRLDDFSFQMGKLSEGESSEEFDLSQAQNRLAAYQELMRKLHVADVQQLAAETQRLTDELSSLETAEADVQASLHELLASAETLQALALKLSKKRQDAAQTVKKTMEKELHTLAMQKR